MAGRPTQWSQWIPQDPGRRVSGRQLVARADGVGEEGGGQLGLWSPQAALGGVYHPH